MKIKNLFISCLLTTPLLYSSCSNEDVEQPILPSTDGPIAFKVNICCASQGDGKASRALVHEAGIDHESDINNAMIIVYDTPINTTGGKIVATYYINNLESGTKPTGKYEAKWYADANTPYTVSNSFSAEKLYTATLPTGLSDGTYFVVALANVNDLRATFTKDAAGFAALRDYVYTGPLYTVASGSEANPNAYTNFAMAAIGEEKFVLNTSSITEGSVALPNLYVQRLASRIDFTFGEHTYDISDIDNPDYDYLMLNAPASGTEYDYPYDSWETAGYFPIYDAKNGKRISGARFVLDKVALVNTVSSGVYLFERNSFQGGTTIFGNEDFEGTGPGTGFDPSLGYAHYPVVSPNNKQYASEVSLNFRDQLALHHPRLHYDSQDRLYAVFGYVRENTFTSHNSSNKYTTVKLTGRTNLTTGNFGDNSSVDYNSGKYANVVATFPIQHCMPSGVVDATKPLAYAIVRNTIYRIMVRFYAEGEKLTVRYYYYGTTYDGKDTGSAIKEQPYPNASTATFYSYIFEGDGTAPND